MGQEASQDKVKTAQSASLKRQNGAERLVQIVKGVKTAQSASFKTFKSLKRRARRSCPTFSSAGSVPIRG